MKTPAAAGQRASLNAENGGRSRRESLLAVAVEGDLNPRKVELALAVLRFCQDLVELHVADLELAEATSRTLVVSARSGIGRLVGFRSLSRLGIFLSGFRGSGGSRRFRGRVGW